jgi:hypothetical protein
MAGEHYPSGWNDKPVYIDFIGGTSSLTGEVIGSTATGCVVKLVPDGEPRGSRARRIFYPWSAIRSIELLEEESEGRTPPGCASAFRTTGVPCPLELSGRL